MKFKRGLFENRVLRNASGYFLISILNKSIPFLLLPVLTVYLTPEDYGIISIFQIVLSVGFILVGINLQSHVGVKYSNSDESTILKNINVSILLSIISFILLIIISFILKDYLSNALKIPYTLVFVAIILSLCMHFINLELVKHQMRENVLRYGLITFSRIIVDVSISVTLIIIFNYYWEGRVIGIITGIMIISFYIIFKMIMKKELKLVFDISIIKEQLKFGLPLIFATISGIILTSSDRLIITNMVDLEQTGLYTVGMQIAMIIGFIGGSFNNAWVPFLFKKLDNFKESDIIKIVRYTYFTIIVFIVFALLLTLISPIIFQIFIDDKYSNAQHFVFWLALGYAFDSCRYLFINYYYYYNKTHISASIFFVVAILNIYLNIIFIKSYGSIGAAIATGISFFINFILTWAFTWYVVDINWFRLKLFR